MDRITIKYNEHYVPKGMCTINRNGEADDCIGCDDACSECDGDCEVCYIAKAFDRLGAYENTELTPEDIKEIDRAYSEQAKELGELRKVNEAIGEALKLIREVLYEK